MINFDDGQVAAFRNVQKEIFVSDVMSLCCDQLPALCAEMEEAELREALERSIDRAEAAGLTWKSNLAASCLLDLRYRCSVLEEPEFKQHFALAAAPDHVFRHMFVGDLADVWSRLDKTGG